MEAQDNAGERLLEQLLGRNNSRAEITINAGGIGVWIATTACCVMLAINVLLGALFVIQDSKISKMQDYLNAIYAQAPQLRPQDEKEK